MLARARQRLQVPLAGDEHVALRARLPARQRQQTLAQRLQPLTRLGRQRNAFALHGGQRAGRRVVLVPHVQQRHGARQLARQLGRDVRILALVIRRVQARQIVQQQHGVGAGDVRPGALDADALHLVIAFAQASGVQHVQGHAFDLNGLLHHVARGAGNRGDDGQLGPRQRVQQAALARVRLARNDHLDAFAQQRALACTRLHAGQ